MDIKKHRFFDKIDWMKLILKRNSAPIKPKIKYPLDTSNFDEQFKDIPVKGNTYKPLPNHRFFLNGNFNRIMMFF